MVNLCAVCVIWTEFFTLFRRNLTFRMFVFRNYLHMEHNRYVLSCISGVIMYWRICSYTSVSLVKDLVTLKTGILNARIARAFIQANSFSNLLARSRPEPSRTVSVAEVNLEIAMCTWAFSSPQLREIFSVNWWIFLLAYCDYLLLNCGPSRSFLENKYRNKLATKMVFD
jgi:hypothetical protein